MQPPHARTQAALRHLARTRTLRLKKVRHAAALQKKNLDAQKSKIIREKTREARKARWEDWFLGPLRPRRGDELREKKGELGEKERQEKERDERLPVLGGRRWEIERREKRGKAMLPAPPPRRPLSFAEGDRVVCVAEKGNAASDRGRIAKVLLVRHEERECVVEGLNLINPYPPRFTAIREGDEEAERGNPELLPQPIPFSSLKVVKTIIDPITNEKEDVIIGLNPEQKHEANSSGLDGSSYDNQPTPTLPSSPYVQSSDPNKPKKIRGEHRPPTYDIDTLRYEVEARTWTPTLLRAPLPGTVIDELRGKYSVFRTRHDDDYVRAQAAKEKEKKAYEAWAKSGGGMLKSPLKELGMKAKADAKAKKDKEELSEGLLEAIGRRMAEKGSMTGVTYKEKVKGERAEGRNGAEKYWPEKIGVVSKGPNRGGRRPEGRVPVELLERDNSDEGVDAR